MYRYVRRIVDRGTAEQAPHIPGFAAAQAYASKYEGLGRLISGPTAEPRAGEGWFRVKVHRRLGDHPYVVWYGPSNKQCRTAQQVVEDGGDPSFDKKRKRAEEEVSEEEEVRAADAVSGAESLKKTDKKARRQVMANKI